MWGRSTAGTRFGGRPCTLVMTTLLATALYASMTCVYRITSYEPCSNQAAAGWRQATTLLERAQLYWNHTTCVRSVCDHRLLPDLQHMINSPYNVSLTEVDDPQYTIVMLTHDRVGYLLKSLKHFGKMTRVAKILVHWNNPGKDFPDVKALGAKMPIVFNRFPPGNKLRLRLHPHPQINTSGAFVIDDDMLIGEEDMNKAFATWKAFPWTIVGFTPRGYRKDGKYPFHYGVGAPSMILTGAAFMHREYMRMYADTLPPHHAAMIDDFVNCEDISMNMMMAYHCRCVHGVYVKPRFEIKHMSVGNGGLWTLNNHTSERSRCLESFQEYYHPMPLMASACMK